MSRAASYDQCFIKPFSEPSCPAEWGHYHLGRDTAMPSSIGHMSTNHFIALRINVSWLFALTDLLAYYWLLCTHTSGAWLRVHGRPQTAGQPQLLNRDSAEGFVQTSVSSPDRLHVPMLPWPPVKNRGPWLTWLLTQPPKGQTVIVVFAGAGWLAIHVAGS